MLSLHTPIFVNPEFIWVRVEESTTGCIATFEMELQVIISSCTINDSNIQVAVDLWISDPTTAEATYGNISNWDTSCVTDMSGLFLNKAMFNDDISQWDVSNVTNMRSMFHGASSFDIEIGMWNVSNVTTMVSMFDGFLNIFNQDIGNWNVSSVTDMSLMFWGNKFFNQDISGWDVSSVNSMYFMFYSATEFNQDIGAWDLSNVANMNAMLNNSGISTANYDAILQGWASQTVQNNVILGAVGLFYCNAEAERQSLIDNFGWTFFVETEAECATSCFINDGNIQAAVDLWISDPTTAEATYGNISNWDTSCVTDMSGLFQGYTTFNDDISQWDTSNVTTMASMFRGADSFNQDIGDWNLSNVIYIREMFSSADSFNQPISDWDVSGITDMFRMFFDARDFNNPIENWDVSNVTNMFAMFQAAEDSIRILEIGMFLM